MYGEKSVVAINNVIVPTLIVGECRNGGLKSEYTIYINI